MAGGSGARDPYRALEGQVVQLDGAPLRVRSVSRGATDERFVVLALEISVALPQTDAAVEAKGADAD
jgi:hypothetical protein